MSPSQGKTGEGAVAVPFPATRPPGGEGSDFSSCSSMVEAAHANMSVLTDPSPGGGGNAAAPGVLEPATPGSESAGFTARWQSPVTLMVSVAGRGCESLMSAGGRWLECQRYSRSTRWVLEISALINLEKIWKWYGSGELLLSLC